MGQEGFIAWAFPLGCALFAAVLGIIARFEPSARAARWGAGGFALSTIAVSIDTLRGTLPDAVIALAVPLHWSAMAVLLQALLHRHGERFPGRALAALLGAGIATHLWHHLIDPATSVRLIISTVVAVALTALALSRHKRFADRAIDRAAIALMIAMIGLHASRLVPFAWEARPYAAGANWLASPYMVMFYIGGGLLAIATALVLLVGTGIDIVEAHMKKSRVDALTGIANRRALDGWIDEDREGRRRFAAALMIDLDHFKTINDRHGHAAGDAALVAVGHVLATTLGGFGAVARVGGEEFVVLIDEAHGEAAAAIGSVARSSIAACACAAPHDAIAVTASVGVARRANGEKLKAVLRRADMALYRAKDGGRNRTVEDVGGDAAGKSGDGLRAVA